MDQIRFLVQGSSEEPYEVVFYRDSDSLYAECNCQAGMFRQYCKHRIRILNGENIDVVSDNLDDIDTIQLWLQGTELESMLKSIEEAENIVSEAKRKLSDAKKGLAQIMYPPS